MAEGYSGWTVLAAGALCLYAGYKLVPYMKRIDQAEKLIEIADNMIFLSEHEPHKLEILKEKRRLQEYLKGIEDKSENPTDDEHQTTIFKFKKGLKALTRPFSRNGKSEKKEEIVAEIDAA